MPTALATGTSTGIGRASVEDLVGRVVSAEGPQG